jgi:lactoylglutathione lyase
MKLGYTIIYVDSVEDALSFYREAFGLETRFLHESGAYGELETGAAALAFASHDIGSAHLGEKGYRRVAPDQPPFGIEVALVTEDVEAAHQRAVAAGARPLRAPERMPWGQTGAWLQSREGTLIELCTPIG